LLLLLLLLPLQSWNSAMKMAGYMYAFTFTGTAAVQNKLLAGATRRSGSGLPDEKVWPRTVALPRNDLRPQRNGRPMRLRANSESNMEKLMDVVGSVWEQLRLHMRKLQIINSSQDSCCAAC
jgi:hypothetical protein